MKISQIVADEKLCVSLEIANDEEGLFQLLLFKSRKEDGIQEKAEPNDDPPQRPHCVKKQQKKNPLAGQPGMGAFGLEKRSIK